MPYYNLSLIHIFLLAAWLWLGKRTLVTSIANSAPGRLLGTSWYNAWGFDWLYDKVLDVYKRQASVAGRISQQKRLRRRA